MQATINWINENTTKDAKFFNWWDQGHILAFLTERRYTTDNRNQSYTANKLMAEFITTQDTNRGYEIAKNLIGADYILLESSMVEGIGSFAYYNIDKVDSSASSKYYTAPLQIINCTDPGIGNVACGSNNIPRDQWDIISAKWKSAPDDFQNGSTPIFFYRTSGELMILNTEVNKTNLAKVWLNSDETKEYYEEVYSASGIKIFKIK